jgi:hypothetical protein
LPRRLDDGEACRFADGHSEGRALRRMAMGIIKARPHVTTGDGHRKERTLSRAAMDIVKKAPASQSAMAIATETRRVRSRWPLRFAT